MAIQLKKASRSMVKLRISIAGASGSGKTMSSLLVGYGLVKADHPEYSETEIWDHICLIDTENGSGSLYVGKRIDRCTIGEYNIIDLDPPYEAKRFIEAIHVAEDAGMDLIIVDSLTHAWSGVGGALDKQGKAAERSGNSWTAWREVTPEHNRLVDTILQSKSHIICCMRAKQEYVQETNANGKKVVKNIGMGVIMRDGIEYEFTTCFMLDYAHNANATKDRTAMFDGMYQVLSPETGVMFHNWLQEGVHEENRNIVQTETPPPEIKQARQVQVEQPTPTVQDPERIKKAKDAIKALTEEIFNAETTEEAKAKRVGEVSAAIKSIAGKANYTKIDDIDVLRAIYKHLNDNYKQ